MEWLNYQHLLYFCTVVRARQQSESKRTAVGFTAGAQG